MKRKLGLFALFVLSVLSCKKDEEPPVVNEETYYVETRDTDAGYPAGEDPHLIMRNNNASTNKLVLFFGGTWSKPETYEVFCDHARDNGFDVISLSYPNNVAAASLKESDDLYAFDNYRDELCYGNAVSDAVEVNELNCIVTRTTKLLMYLSQTYPDQNWAQYLVDGNAPNWSRIIVAGHSQGSGHAAYLAKMNNVNRALMFSGPNDYSTHFEAAGNWLSMSGLTPVSQQYIFLHAEDEVVPYERQFINAQALGLLGAEDTTILMDDLDAPYGNYNAYHTNITAISNHGSTTGSNWKLPAFWDYLLGVE